MSDLDSARAAWAAVPEEAKRRVRAVLNTSRLLSSFLADEAAYRAAIAVLEAAAAPDPLRAALLRERVVEAAVRLRRAELAFCFRDDPNAPDYVPKDQSRKELRSSGEELRAAIDALLALRAAPTATVNGGRGA